MSVFGIAGIQMLASIGDNLDAMGRKIAVTKARFPWVEMVVFGELSTFGPRPELAQRLPGPAEEHFRALARQHDVWLIPGSLYELGEGDVYNTAPVINPAGEVVVRYRKMFPFYPYEKGVQPGREFVTFTVPDVGCFGISICYDKWFPETTRTLAWMGAEVIIHPTLTNSLDRDVELSIARASAATNQAYFFDINNAGEMSFGRSTIIGPEGDVIHEAGSGAEIMPVMVDFERVRRTRDLGVMGLGQPLKSFRDAPADFPPYAPGARQADSLTKLGALRVPQSKRRRRDPEREASPMDSAIE
jgi:predicted amidohydrolase